MMKKIVVLILVAFAVFACSSDDDSLGVNVRVANVSDFELEDITVNASTNDANVFFTMEKLSPGEFTEYQNFPEVFPNPWANINVEGETLVWHGFTTGHDVPYFEGNFTCFIDIVEDHNQENSLLLVLVKDNE